MNDIVAVDQRTKWNVTTQAVYDMLATFSAADFVNVVTFSDEATPLWTRTGLVRGEVSNLELLRDAMSRESPGTQTNFTAAFQTAFRLLSKNCNDEPKSCSNCQKIILFLTDGSDTSLQYGASVKPSNILASIEEFQKELYSKTYGEATIFTYTITEQADDAIPRLIACRNNGAWSLVRPGMDILDALESYFLQLAYGRTTSYPIWIEPYEDFSGTGIVTTVALPVYAHGSKHAPGVFLGVVGHDIRLEELAIEGFSAAEVLDAVIDRSETCVHPRKSHCNLQAFREVRDQRALCTDVFPTEAGPSKAKTPSIPLELCYEWHKYFYKRFSEETLWEDADAKCIHDGGELVTIADADELAFVANMASPDGSWIGAHRKQSGEFAWRKNALNIIGRKSPFWSVGQPSTTQSTKYCVSIDSRGVIGNLQARPCRESLSFICKYKNNTSCASGTQSVPGEGYFVTPPPKICSHPEALVETRPVPEANHLEPSKVICNIELPMVKKKGPDDLKDEQYAQDITSSMFMGLVGLLMGIALIAIFYGSGGNL